MGKLMVFKRMLITTDFSRHAAYALKRAIQVAEHAQAELTCLHVINQGWLSDLTKKENPEVPILIKKAELAHAEAMRNIVARYPVNFLVLVGRVPERINQYMHEHAIELVFMGAHGTYYLNDYILGTNAESVVNQVKIPVQLIKKEPSFSYQRILVTTDFSEVSKKATETAYQLYPHAEFLMLHVADVWYGKYLDDTKHHQHFDDEMSQALVDRLKHSLAECAVDHSRFSTKFISGYPADDIAKYAATWDAQLVVLGTRGRSLLHYILLGRVTNRLLRIINTDMLVIPF
ncbi:universal stress protein [Legionella septentrionalis]|uniref:Universal stress protein n=2 Tax=Legionella septentrionalis TaxID=2498109 RepID=A0A433JI04_9GAMM|nr:universal stress protein [Legionella septentrionalis]